MRWAILCTVMECSQIRPGPVNVPRKIPSPPKSMFVNPLILEMLNVTDGSNMATCPGSILIVSPGAEGRRQKAEGRRQKCIRRDLWLLCLRPR